jgi:hypothetical protein
MVTVTRDRILTENEKHGSGFLDEDAPGGVWVVTSKSNTGISGHVAHLFSNRDAAEAYIHDKCEEKGWPLHRYGLAVWAVSETWPDEDEGSE